MYEIRILVVGIILQFISNVNKYYYRINIPYLKIVLWIMLPLNHLKICTLTTLDNMFIIDCNVSLIHFFSYRKLVV